MGSSVLPLGRYPLSSRMGAEVLEMGLCSPVDDFWGPGRVLPPVPPSCRLGPHPALPGAIPAAPSHVSSELACSYKYLGKQQPPEGSGRYI